MSATTFKRQELEAAIESGRILHWDLSDDAVADPLVSGATERRSFYCDLADGRLYHAPVYSEATALTHKADVGAKERSTVDDMLSAGTLLTVMPSIELWRHNESAEVPVYFHAGRLVVGPRLAPKAADGVCGHCALVRLLASSPHGPVLAAAWRAQFVIGDWAVDQVTTRQHRLLQAVTAVAHAPGTAVSIRLASGAEFTHRVSNLPGHPRHAVNDLTTSMGLS